MTSGRRDHVNTGRGSEEPTLVICIRCTQRFLARTSCPHCSDLSIATVPDPDDTENGAWIFELLEKSASGSLATIARAGGFGDQADAVEHAQEFLRHYVAQRRASGGS